MTTRLLRREFQTCHKRLKPGIRTHSIEVGIGGNVWEELVLLIECSCQPGEAPVVIAEPKINHGYRSAVWMRSCFFQGRENLDRVIAPAGGSVRKSQILRASQFRPLQQLDGFINGALPFKMLTIRFLPRFRDRIRQTSEDVMKRTLVAMITFVAVLTAWTNTTAQAAEITILVNQGALSGVRDLAAGYEKATGHKVVIDFAGVPQQDEKIKTDAPGDLVVNFMPAFDQIIKDGKVIGPVVEFARAGNGVAVKAGAPRPDISTAEGFKRAMLNAKSIGHTNAGTGPYNTRLFQKLGIYDQIKDKIKIITGKPVAVAVAEGEVEIGIQQTNVIQPVAGTTYLGPLPPELIEYGHFGVAVRNVSKNEAVARDLIKFMTSPEAAALLRKSAMEPPAY